MSLEDAAFAALPLPAFVLDGADEICALNPAAEDFAGLSARQAVGTALARYTGPASALTDLLAQAREQAQRVVRHEFALDWFGQPRGTVGVQVSALGEGAPPGAVLLLLHPRGYAERLDRSFDARSAARSVTGMAMMLAHEIRNPLAGITGAAQLLEMALAEAGLGADEQALPGLIRDEAVRIGQLVDRVEAFGDLAPVPKTPVNIHDVLQQALRAVRAAHRDGVGHRDGVTIEERYDPSLPPVPGHDGQLMQLFRNLLLNAVEALPAQGGRIRIETAYRPGVRLAQGAVRAELPLLVVIEDNGAGIAEDLIGDIYSPFVTSKVNGSGLGLAMVSKILSAHGGIIEVASCPGCTRFELRLPVCRP